MECYRCGYCCKNMEVPYQWWDKAENLDIPRKSTPKKPCPHLNEVFTGFYECKIHYTTKPRFCELNPNFESISKEKLEDMLNKGKPVPKCLVIDLF